MIAKRPNRKRKKAVTRRVPATKSWQQRTLVAGLEHWADQLLGIPFDPSGQAREHFEKEAAKRDSLGPIPLTDNVRKEVARFLRRLAQMTPGQLETILLKRRVGRSASPRNNHITLDIRLTRERFSVIGRNTKDADAAVMAAWGITRSELYRVKAQYEQLEAWRQWSDLWTSYHRAQLLKQEPGIQEADLLDKLCTELRQSGKT